MARKIVVKVMCALLVAALMFPVGQMIFPYLDIGTLLFNAIEATLSASLGFGLAGLVG